MDSIDHLESDSGPTILTNVSTNGSSCTVAELIGGVILLLFGNSIDVIEPNTDGRLRCSISAQNIRSLPPCPHLGPTAEMTRYVNPPG